VSKLKGVSYSYWNASSNTLYVEYDSSQTGKSPLLRKIADAGHDNELYTASDRVYKKLPACCHYDRKLSLAEAMHDAAGVQVPVRKITGRILGRLPDGGLFPLAGARVATQTGEPAVDTDDSGFFQMLLDAPDSLVVSHSGYKADTVALAGQKPMDILLDNDGTTLLADVTVRSQAPSAFIPNKSVLNTLQIGTRELAKAACCNLSESFETTPSVDVSYSDAAMGVRQIQLLGLSGSYAQLLMENIPESRGLSGSFGLTFIPGPWVSGIQVTKGTGSVVNGYESISGQI